MKIYRSCKTLTVTALYELENGADVSVGGKIIHIDKTQDEPKRSQAAVEIEDDENRLGIIVSPEAYEQWSVFIEYDAIVVVSGKLTVKDGEPVILADTIWPMNFDRIGGV